MSKTASHPVTELVRARALEGSRPRRRRDEYKLGLAVEGGAMRGVVSAGMVSALEYLELLDVFDAVYGASAGAFNAAYFVAGQAAYGTTVYYDSINNKQFINLARLLYRRPIVNLDYVIETVLLNEKVLDYEAVLGSDISLNVVASSLSRLDTAVFNNFRTREELFDAFRASSKMPFVAGAPIEIGGELYLDASLCESIPVYAALNDGCTHVLVLLTKPEGQLFGKSTIAELLVARQLDKIKKGVGKVFLDGNEKYNETIRYIKELTDKPGRQPHVFSICLPRGAPAVDIAEKRRGVLKSAAAAGMSRALRVLTGEAVQVTEILAPFDQKGRVYRGR